MPTHESDHEAEFSGVSGRFWGWMMAGWPRPLLERFFFGDPASRVLELLALHGSEVVVDAGAGSGYYSLALARRLPKGRVISVDISPTMLAGLRKRATSRRLMARLTILEGDCGALPLNAGEADAAVTVAVWHHLPDWNQAARELFRVLKPGGKIVSVDWLVSPHQAGKNGQSSRHDAHPFGVQEMQGCLAQAGFASIAVEIKGRWVIGHGSKP